MTLDQILDETNLLSKEDLFVFNDVLNNRVRELKRLELIDSVKQSQFEYESGQAEQATVNEIMQEIFA